MENNIAFTLISFVVQKWDDYSVQELFELPVQIMVQLLLELQANWLVNELEFELSKTRKTLKIFGGLVPAVVEFEKINTKS